MRLSNNQLRDAVRNRKEFTNNTGSVYAKWVGDRYVVYSYGEHFPLYVWTGNHWFVNADKYSVTTSKHASLCNPRDNTITEVNTSGMKKLAQGE